MQSLSRTLVFAHEGVKRNEVAELLDKYNLQTLPVVDEHNKLTGVITSDDVGLVCSAQTIRNPRASHLHSAGGETEAAAGSQIRRVHFYLVDSLHPFILWPLPSLHSMSAKSGHEAFKRSKTHLLFLGRRWVWFYYSECRQ